LPVVFEASVAADAVVFAAVLAAVAVVLAVLVAAVAVVFAAVLVAAVLFAAVPVAVDSADRALACCPARADGTAVARRSVRMAARDVVRCMAFSLACSIVLVVGQLQSTA
jgi:hypothetical protein